MIHDIEIYKNLFLVIFANDGKRYVFEISNRKDQRDELYNFLSENRDAYFIGYNSDNFDIPVLERFISLYRSTKLDTLSLITALYKFAQSIINTRSFKPRKYLHNSIDLFLLNHFDNKAKMTSLKDLEFVMQMDIIESLPYKYDSLITDTQIDEIIKYCHNDIDATEKLYEISKEEIQMRMDIKDKYGIECLSYNSPKIGEEIFKKILTEKGINTNRKTVREQIVISDILFNIEFTSEPFKAIYQWFVNRIINSTKGVFSELPLSDIEPLKPHINETIVKKNFQKNLNIVYNGLEYVFGTGGIHACIDSGIYEADKDYIILDIDVSSFYPNLAKVNKLYPNHLSEIFCDIYGELYDERQKYPKSSAINKALKLALNGVYGKSNSEYSFFYDPAYTMSITLNGQLLICKLAEMISQVSNVTILQANTDGITIKLLKSDLDKMMLICNDWENYTNLKLEYAQYSKMIIRDVNNYIAIYTDGKVKRKGCFKYVFKKELDLHENHSFLIIQKALDKYYTEGIEPEEFLRNHTNINDFFGRVKLKSGSTLELVYENKTLTLDKITRYFVSKEGGTFRKTTESGRTQTVEKDRLCTVCNDKTGLDWDYFKDKIDYDYYLTEIYKIINSISNV